MSSDEATRAPGDWAGQTWANFGAKVRALRKERGWSQTDIAEQLKRFGIEMHQTTVAKLEGGTRPTAVHEVFVLAKLLDSNYDELLPPLGQGFAGTDELAAAMRRESRLKGIATAAEQEAARTRMEAEKAAEEVQRLLEASVAKSRDYLRGWARGEHDLPPEWDDVQAARLNPDAKAAAEAELRAAFANRFPPDHLLDEDHEDDEGPDHEEGEQ